MKPSIVIVCLLLVLPLAGYVPVASAQAGPNSAKRPLVGHVIHGLSSATRLPTPAGAGDEPMTVALLLNWSDPTGFATLAREFEDPSSTNYRLSVNVKGHRLPRLPDGRKGHA